MSRCLAFLAGAAQPLVLLVAVFVSVSLAAGVLFAVAWLLGASPEAGPMVLCAVIVVAVVSVMIDAGRDALRRYDAQQGRAEDVRADIERGARRTAHRRGGR